MQDVDVYSGKGNKSVPAPLEFRENRPTSKGPLSPPALMWDKESYDKLHFFLWVFSPGAPIDVPFSPFPDMLKRRPLTQQVN